MYRCVLCQEWKQGTSMSRWLQNPRLLTSYRSRLTVITERLTKHTQTESEKERERERERESGRQSLLAGCTLPPHVPPRCFTIPMDEQNRTELSHDKDICICSLHDSTLIPILVDTVGFMSKDPCVHFFMVCARQVWYLWWSCGCQKKRFAWITCKATNN